MGDFIPSNGYEMNLSMGIAVLKIPIVGVQCISNGNNMFPLWKIADTLMGNLTLFISNLGTVITH